MPAAVTITMTTIMMGMITTTGTITSSRDAESADKPTASGGVMMKK